MTNNTPLSQSEPPSTHGQVDLQQLLDDLHAGPWRREGLPANYAIEGEGIFCLHGLLAEEGVAGVGLWWCEASMTEDDSGTEFYHGVCVLEQGGHWWVAQGASSREQIETQRMSFPGRQGSPAVIEWMDGADISEWLLPTPRELREKMRECVLQEKIRMAARNLDQGTGRAGGKPQPGRL